MDLIHGFKTKRSKNTKNFPITGIAFNAYKPYTHWVIIRLPFSWILKFVSRFVLLALVIVSLPWINSILGGLTSHGSHSLGINYDAKLVNDSPINIELLTLIFHDLADEGLLKTGDRTLVLTNGNEDAIYDSQILRDNNDMDLISYLDSDRQSLVPDQTFDFAFDRGFHSPPKFIDRALKLGGIVTFQLNNNPLVQFKKPSNYKIVYLRRFNSISTFVAMRKTSFPVTNSLKRRRLCGFESEAKKEALKKLEDVLLEPPRSASGRSNSYIKKTKYLPDLMGDSLESYPRRIFIHVGLPDKNDATSDATWFAKHYPTRNKDFEIYKIETVTEESSGREVLEIGMSDWLRKNVKENEYLVMKAEAEVVEEMVKSKAIRLVDELFLECKHQGIKKGDKRSRRAYWECLALYGRLRDEGIAVHQWWG